MEKNVLFGDCEALCGYLAAVRNDLFPVGVKIISLNEQDQSPVNVRIDFELFKRLFPYSGEIYFSQSANTEQFYMHTNYYSNGDCYNFWTFATEEEFDAYKNEVNDNEAV